MDSFGLGSGFVTIKIYSTTICNALLSLMHTHTTIGDRTVHTETFRSMKTCCQCCLATFINNLILFWNFDTELLHFISQQQGITSHYISVWFKAGRILEIKWAVTNEYSFNFLPLLPSSKLKSFKCSVS